MTIAIPPLQSAVLTTLNEIFGKANKFKKQQPF